MNTAKPFTISKQLLVQAYRKVKANKGSAEIGGLGRICPVPVITPLVQGLINNLGYKTAKII